MPASSYVRYHPVLFIHRSIRNKKIAYRIANEKLIAEVVGIAIAAVAVILPG